MQIKKRSAYGLGILACKLKKTLDDNPFTDETIAGIPKAKMWNQGFLHCETQRWGNMFSDKDGKPKNYEIEGSGL